MKIFGTTALLIIACFVTSLQAQDMTKTFDAIMNENFAAGEPGATVMVTRKGEILYHKAFGMANVEHQIPMRPDHVLQIGSITKQFTAISILMLMEQGKLKLDDDITRYIPDYPTYGHHISIHHLLTHTSGIKSYTSMEKWTKVWRQDFTPEELIQFFKNEPMDFIPGENYAYNNSAYFILGYIIEKASGQSYEDFVENNIFKPLGLKNAYYGHSLEIISNRAAGYQRQEEYLNAEYLSMTQPYAAGSLMMTVEDLYIWNKAVHAYKLVKKETLELAFKNYTLKNGEKINYGYGWGLNEINGSPTLEHSGGIFGFVTDAIYLPEEDVFVAIFSNCDCLEDQSIGTRMAAIAIGKPFKGVQDAITLTTPELQPFTGVYEFADSIVRYITLEGNQLYSQRKGGTKFKIYPVSKDQFIYESSLSNIRFFSKGLDMFAEFSNRIDQTEGIKTDEPLSEVKELQLPVDVLNRYVGVYDIAPGFAITFTVEDGKLMTQATGQSKFEVFAETETSFFLKVVDAKIEFTADETGQYNAMMLYQGGMEIPGKRSK